MDKRGDGYVVKGTEPAVKVSARAHKMSKSRWVMLGAGVVRARNTVGQRQGSRLLSAAGLGLHACMRLRYSYPLHHHTPQTARQAPHLTPPQPTALDTAHAQHTPGGHFSLLVYHPNNPHGAPPPPGAM